MTEFFFSSTATATEGLATVSELVNEGNESESIEDGSMSVSSSSSSSESATTTNGFASVSDLIEFDSVVSDIQPAQGDCVSPAADNFINENVAMENADINLTIDENVHGAAATSNAVDNTANEIAVIVQPDIIPLVRRDYGGATNNVELAQGDCVSQAAANFTSENVAIENADINLTVDENVQGAAAISNAIDNTGASESLFDMKPVVPLFPLNSCTPNGGVIVISSDESDTEENGASCKVAVKTESKSTWQHDKFLMKDEIRRLRIHCRALQDRILNPNYGVPIASSTLINDDTTSCSSENENENKENEFNEM